VKSMLMNGTWVNSNVSLINPWKLCNFNIKCYIWREIVTLTI
jgi:hypothetical protein